MTDRVLYVVPTERHVERLGISGHDAETRTHLARRLSRSLLPGARWASPEVTRLALTDALRATLWDDPLLGGLVRAGGSSFLRTVELVDSAIGELRRAAPPVALLDRVDKSGGGAGLRASTLRRAIVALDRTLEARGLVDARAEPRVLADALARATSDEIARALRATRLAARYIVVWDAADLAWWTALAGRLERAGGSAVIELPVFEKDALDMDRDRDPLEVVFDDLLARLDEPPATVALAPVLGDFVGGLAPVDVRRLSVVAAADASRQARAVTHAVVDALADGVPLDRVAIALPQLDEETLVPLRRALEEAGVPFHEPRGAPPSASAIVATALDAHALAGRGLPRLDVAMLLRSRYVDPVKLTGIGDRPAAARALRDIAEALEAAPTVTASTMAQALEETIVQGARDGESLRPVAQRLATTLASVEEAKSRSAHARAARSLWETLGFPARVSLDARYTLAEDAVPEGIARAELMALAEDAHGWRVLVDALDAYVGAVVALGAGASPATAETFRHELLRTLEAGAPRPGAGRVGAVRIARLSELAGERLTCLFVLDVNDGVVPSGGGAGPLLTDGLVTRLRNHDALSAPVTPALARARELASVALAAAAVERITLFYREAGRDGEALAPAPIVLSLMRAGAAFSRAGGGALIDAPLSAREARLQALARGETVVDAEDATRRARLERARERHHGGAPLTGPDEALAWLTADDLLRGTLDADVGSARALPVTSVERFARCAFQGYVHQILGAREVRVAAETPDARESGTIVHEALAHALRAAAPLLAARPVDADAVRSLAMEAADAVLRRGGESLLRSLALELARERVLRVVEWTIAEAEWVFLVAEQSFGDERAPDGWPALVIGEGADAVRLRGSIDRVDTSREAGREPRRVRVIDYKSGTAAVREARRSLGETMLQVPIYALAAERALGAVDASGLYVPVAELEPGFGGDDPLAKRWAETMADGAAPLRARVLDVMARVRRGELAPTPEEESFCDSCSYDGVCRRPRFVAAEEEPSGGGGGDA